MSTFSKTGTAERLTFDELGSTKWKNKPSNVSPTPAEGISANATASSARWLREGRQVVVTRDGITGTISFLPATTSSGDITMSDAYMPKINDRWDDDISSPLYNLICVSIKETPYGVTSNGTERFLYTAEFSTQPLDPTEIDFGGDFISCKGTPEVPNGFYWSDNSAVTQTLHKVSLSIKFKITKRRAKLPYDDIVARLGCVNSDDVNIPNNRGTTCATILGTDDGNNPECAYLLFEGCKAVETTDPEGGVMWKLIYSFTAKYNWDSTSSTPVGWNSIFNNSTGRFDLVHYGNHEATPQTRLYREKDLSTLIADEAET